MGVKWLKTRICKATKGEKGAMSLPFVVLILILLFAFCAFVDEYKTTITITETEAILDLAAVEALRYGVVESEWNQGNLMVNHDVAKQKFVDILAANIKGGSAGNIESYTIVDGLDGIKLTYDDNGLATGIHMSQPDESGSVVNTNVQVESYFLSCVVNVNYRVRLDTDFIGTVTTTFFNIFADEEQKAEATMENSLRDGYITVPIQVVGKVTLQ